MLQDGEMALDLAIQERKGLRSFVWKGNKDRGYYYGKENKNRVPMPGLRGIGEIFLKEVRSKNSENLDDMLTTTHLSP